MKVSNYCYPFPTFLQEQQKDGNSRMVVTVLTTQQHNNYLSCLNARKFILSSILIHLDS